MREGDLSDFHASIYISFLKISVQILLGELSSAASPPKCFKISENVFATRCTHVKDNTEPKSKAAFTCLTLYLRKPQLSLNQINTAAVYKHTNLYIILNLILNLIPCL